MPDGAPLARMQVAALEWLPGGNPVQGSGGATNDRKSVDTARQLGQWLWLCFYFEVSDRKPANWVWSEDEKTIAMIDFEDWRPGKVKPEQLLGPVREILGGQITLDHAKAILNGLQLTKNAWTTAREQLVSPFSHHGEKLDSDFVNEDLVDVTAKVSSIGRPDLIS